MFYATYDQHFPSESEERAGYWVGFGEHSGDAMTHKILNHDTQKMFYRSAARPKKSSTPNHRLAPHGEEESEYLMDSVANHQTKSIWLVTLTTAVSPWGNRVVRLTNKENGSCTTYHLGAVAHTSSTGLATRGNPKITPGEARMIGNHGSNAKTQTVVYNTQSRK